MLEGQVCRLGEVIAIKHGFAFPGGDFSDDPSFPSLVTPGNFAVGGGFKHAKPKTFAGDFPSEYRLASGDLVVTMTDLSKEGATLGLPAVVPAGRSYLHNQRIGLVEVRDTDRVTAPFLHYYLRTAEYRSHILATATGSTVRHTSPSRICSFVAHLPPVLTQRVVAELLGALDDKIAANRNLAVVADDCVRAGFAVLASKAGSAVKISQLADHPRNLIDPTVLDPDTPYVGLEHVPRRMVWLDSAGRAAEVTSTKAAYCRGDVLFGKLRPYFHKVVIAPTAGICSTDILVVRSKRKELTGFLLAATSSDETVERCTAASEGTRMPRTSWKDLGAVSVPWPGGNEAIQFGALVDSIRMRVDAAVVENDILGRVRDALLPELMSGRMMVRAAERVVAEVV